MATAAKDDPRSLSGPEKAGVLMLALGEEYGAKLWQMMQDEEIKEISQAMSNLGSISATLVERLLVDFVSNVSSGGTIVGSYESTERLLSKLLPGDRASLIMEEIRGPASPTLFDMPGNVTQRA